MRTAPARNAKTQPDAGVERPFFGTRFSRTPFARCHDADHARLPSAGDNRVPPAFSSRADPAGPLFGLASLDEAGGPAALPERMKETRDG